MKTSEIQRCRNVHKFFKSVRSAKIADQKIIKRIVNFLPRTTWSFTKAELSEEFVPKILKSISTVRTASFQLFHVTLQS